MTSRRESAITSSSGIIITSTAAQTTTSCYFHTRYKKYLLYWYKSTNTDASYSAQPAAYLKEAAPPDLRCLSYTHDRDYEAFLDVPKGRRRREQAAWCPPTQFCYDQMEPIALRVAKRAAVSGNTDDEL